MNDERKNKRRPIPTAIEAQLLVDCRRRCCLCYFWGNDSSEKVGQIAHIERSPSNNDYNNLVYLCFKHHNEYDRRESQGKGITQEEVRQAKKRLNDFMRTTNEVSWSVTLTFDRDFDSFSDSEQKEIMLLIEKVVQRQGSVEIRRKSRGSVILSFDLKSAEVKKLFVAIEAGELDRFLLSRAEVHEIVSATASFGFAESYLDGISHYAIPRQQVLQIISSPDAKQHLLLGKPVDESNSICSIYTKFYGGRSSGEAYTALVVAGHSQTTLVVFTALRVYSADMRHSSYRAPLDTLRAFLEVYGSEKTLPKYGTKRLFMAAPLTLPSMGMSRESVDNYLKTFRYFDTAATPGPVEWHDIWHFMPDIGNIVIELSFGISLRKYVKALRRHKVCIPETEKYP